MENRPTLKQAWDAWTNSKDLSERAHLWHRYCDIRDGNELGYSMSVFGQAMLRIEPDTVPTETIDTMAVMQ